MTEVSIMKRLVLFAILLVAVMIGAGTECSAMTTVRVSDYNVEGFCNRYNRFANVRNTPDYVIKTRPTIVSSTALYDVYKIPFGAVATVFLYTNKEGHVSKLLLDASTKSVEIMTGAAQVIINTLLALGPSNDDIQYIMSNMSGNARVTRWCAGIKRYLILKTEDRPNYINHLEVTAAVD